MICIGGHVEVHDQCRSERDRACAEEGTHENLTRMGGRYAELFELQAASYR